MRLTRRTACLAAPALGVRPLAAATEAITLLSGSPPGSLGFLWVQSFAPFLERHWPFSSVRVVTVTGDGGLAAVRRVVSAPSGVCAATSTPQLLSQMFETGASDLLDSLSLVGAVVEEAVVLVGQRGDAADAALRRPAGAVFTLGIPPAGSAGALVARALVELGAGIEPINFANAAAARKAVETGSMPLALLALPEAIDSIREGRLTAIGVAGTSRAVLLPETPTLGELGQPVTLVARRGIVLPRAASPKERQRLEAALAAIVADPEFAAQAHENGYLPKFVRSLDWDAESRRLLRRMAGARR